MYQIDESRRTEERRMRRDILSKRTDFLGHKLPHSLILRSETFHKILADTIILCLRQYPLNILAQYLAILQLQSDVDIGQHHSIACRINNQHRISGNIHHLLTFAGMIMSHQYHIESRNILCHIQRRILIIFTGHLKRILSGMEQPDYHIRILLCTDYLHPFASRLLHIVKTKPSPQIFRKPGRNGRCNHPQNDGLHPVPFQHFIRRKMRFPRRRINDIGSQYRKVTGSNPTVEYSTSSFHIMIPHIARIIFHIIHHLGTKMRRHGIYIIIVISGRLSLQNIPIIQQYQIIFILPAFLLNK